MGPFGVSTHLFHEQRLSRDHLVHIAAHGFDAVELFATRAHFDYHSDTARAELAEWLSDTGLELHSVHAPAFDALRHGQWVGSFSNAAADESRRRRAITEAEAALALARHTPFHFLVVHLGVPVSGPPSAGQHEHRGGGRRTDHGGPAGDNQPEAARRSIEELVARAAEVNVRIALEVIPNPLSSAEALSGLIEDELDGLDVGICLDYGHAHLMGDLGDAIETISGHLWTTHVHDNGGTRDDHLVPFAGTIDWDAALMTTQKIGYDGAMMLEVGDTGDPIDVLRRSAKARERLEKALVL